MPSGIKTEISFDTRYAGIEFGENRNKKETYTSTSRRGKKYQVTRRVQRQLRPRKKSGYVVMPAAADVIPRYAALFYQTAVRTLHEAMEAR